MTDNKSPLTDDQLEKAFDALRADAPMPSPELMARIVADAERVMSEPARSRAVRPAPSLIARFFAGLGGVPAVAGLAAVACLGIGVGLNPPAIIQTLEASMFGTADVYLLDMIPDLQVDLIDG